MSHFDLARTGVRAPGKPADGLYSRFGKRTLDISLVVLLLPVLLPLIIVLILLARRDGAPGLYGHKRIGRGGRIFYCWKIRTMVPDADKALQEYLTRDPHAALEWAKSFKLKKDPRVTRLGRFLRKTSLDELPQIWNVLRAEMSLVGPRPITAAELVFYGRDQRVYLSKQPGVTGMWQVHGRAEGCYSARVRYDRRYAQEMGLAKDMTLIARTVVCMLSQTGS